MRQIVVDNNEPEVNLNPGLDALFNPKSIAFIGVSQKRYSPASRGLRNSFRLGFKGGLYPINPKYDEVHGVRCYPSLDAVPDSIDLAMIAVSADGTLDAIEQCRQKGVKTVVVCSSGWREIGEEGAARADRLDELLRGSGIRLLGPNSLGVGSVPSRFCLGYNSSFEEVRFPRVGRVGLISQSGAMLGGLVLNAEEQGADLAMIAHVGNAQDLTSEELARYMLHSESVDVVAMMIEGLKDPAGFVECGRLARKLGKALVVFKAGASELGRSAVQSHTGALAGSDEVFSAVCKEEGIIRVDESEDLLPTAALISNWKGRSRISKGNVLVFTLSGGAASIIADHAERRNLSIPMLSPDTTGRLERILPSYTRPANPFDVGGGVFSDATLPKRALQACIEDESTEAVLWVSVGAPRDERSCQMLNEALDVASGSSKPFLVVPTSGYPQESGFDRCRREGIPVASSIRSAMAMISAAVEVNRRPHIHVTDPPAVVSMVTALEGETDIDEAAAKTMLKNITIPVPLFEVADDTESAVAAADRIGYPVVLKGILPGVHHKTELGLVRLGLADSEAVRNAADNLFRNMSGHSSNGRVLVEEMISIDQGIEAVVGVVHDHQFGPMLMVGLGGVAVELYEDVAFGQCPTTPERALDMIHRTRLGTMLAGFRGRPKGDVEGLVSAMVSLSNFAVNYGEELAECDINPLLVGKEGAGVVALDAVMIRR